MNKSAQISLSEKENQTMHPKSFNLWLFIVSIIMFFAALTSAYIVRQGDDLKEWLIFDLPSLFYWSTGVILVSSITMHWAFLAAKRNELTQVKIGLWITFLLGVVFLVMQVMGWGQLVEGGIYLAGTQSNPAGSFVYIISGAHGLHIVAGLVFLIVAIIRTMQHKIHSKNINTIRMCTTFWHFLDLLWVYLFLFFLYFRNPV